MFGREDFIAYIYGSVMRPVEKTLIVVSLFAIAMGLLESAVVIYLRDILYPGGFEFPLNPVRPDLVWTEILRELATLVMLLGVGILAGRNLAERFAWFMYSFAVWDIFYYAFLRVLIGWPESLMTWDVLFLLPVTWTGPVITPLIVSATMIFFALIIILAGREVLRLPAERIQTLLGDNTGSQPVNMAGTSVRIPGGKVLIPEHLAIETVSLLMSAHLKVVGRQDIAVIHEADEAGGTPCPEVYAAGVLGLNDML